MRMLDLFKARQCYLRVNGRYIPMTLEEVNDETEYTIENRKFFVQSFVIKAMAYITRREDFKVSKFPKNVMMFNEGLTPKKKKKVEVEIEEYTELKNTVVEIAVDFAQYVNKAEFEMDDDVSITEIRKDNVSQVRLQINGKPLYSVTEFKLNNGDDVKIKIFPIDESKASKITLVGIKPNSTYVDGDLPEDVSKTPVSVETITVE